MRKNLFLMLALAATTMLSSNAVAQNVAGVVSAQGDTTKYNSLEAAFDAANDYETIVLLEDINGGSTITLDTERSLTFNMNGKEWNLNDGVNTLALGIDVQAGDLTVNGFGGMHDTIADATCFRVGANAELVIEGGNYSSKTGNSDVFCTGKLSVEPAWVKNIILTDGGEATLNGAHVNGNVFMPTTGKASLEVLGGEINKITGMSSANELTVKAGTITTVECAGKNLYVKGTVKNILEGTNTIEGGKFTNLSEMAYYTLKGGVYASDTLSNGAKIDSLVVEGYSVKPNGTDTIYKFQVSKDLVKITRTGVVYGTIDEALKAAVDGDTVKLQENIELGGNLNVYLAGVVTLDLNGNTWSLSNDKEFQQGGMRIYSGELVVIGNGAMVYGGESGSCTFFDVKKGAKLTIESGVFTTGSIYCDGELVIKDGEFKSVSLGLKATAATIDGGSISSQFSLPYNPDTLVNVVINGGQIENICTANGKARGVYVTVNDGEINWLQNGDSTFIKGGTITHINGGLNVISGGKLDSLYYHNCADTASFTYRSCAYTIQGGMFVDVKYITDGVEREISADFAPGFELVANTDPETMEEYPWVAKSTTTSVEEMSSESKVQDAKVIRDGQLMIIRDGVRYNAQGARL